MIWVRRFFAVLLALLFLPLFVTALLLLHINATVLSANFYVDELRKAGLPVFLYDELLPAAFDEFAAESWDVPADPKVVRAKAIGALREVFPPEWLQEQSEAVVNEVVPYVTGETDSFTITVPVKDRLTAFGEVVKREAASADTYNLAFDGALAPALEDAIAGLDLPYGIVLPADDVVAGVREVVSPQWLGAVVANAVDQVAPYLTGDADHFAVQLPVADRIKALAPVLKEILAHAQVYQVLSNPELAASLDKFLANLGVLPLDLKLTSAELLPVLQAAAPPSWIQAQAEQVLDALVPYVTGESDTFRVVIPLKEPLQRSVPPFKDLLREMDAYDVLVGQVLGTLVTTAVPQPVEIVGGVTINAEEVGDALKGSLSPQFVEQQAGALIDGVVPYLTGDTLGFSVTIPLATQKVAVASALENLVVDKLWQAIAPLRPCTPQETIELAQKGFLDSVPPCKPEGVTHDNLKGLLGPTLSSQVRQVVVNNLPDQWAFTQASLPALGGPDQQALLDRFRKRITEGFVFTDADLRKAMASVGGGKGEEYLDLALKRGSKGFTYTDADLREDMASLQGNEPGTVDLDDVLRITRQGYTYTEADLRKQLDPDGTAREVRTLQDVKNVLGSNEAQPAETLDAAGWVVGRFHSYVWLAYVVLAVLLAAIGFLGGRRWRSRLAWAAVVLAFASGMAFVVAGPVYQAVGRPALETAMSPKASADASKVGQLAAEKGAAVAQTVINDLVAGLAWRALVFLAIALVALGVAIVGPRLLGRGARRQTPDPAGG